MTAFSLPTPTDGRHLLASQVKRWSPVTANICGAFCYYFFACLSIGLIPLVLVWQRRLWPALRYRSVRGGDATHALMVDHNGDEHLAKIRYREGMRVIKFRCIYYFLQDEQFIALKGTYPMTQEELIRKSSTGLTAIEAGNLLRLFGKNHTLIEVDTIWKLLVEEVLTSYNIYQLFAVFIWIAFRDYLWYALIVLLAAIVSIIIQIHIIRSEQIAINAGQSHGPVKVIRQDSKDISGQATITTVDSWDLVPGDLIELDDDQQVPCDLVLVSGYCYVDEAILTGESVPVYKSAIHCTNQAFNEDNKENMLFYGTHCIRSGDRQGKARGMVTQTGFNTNKGHLIKSLVFSEEKVYVHERDSTIFLISMFAVAILFFVYYFFWVAADLEGTSFT